MIQMAKKVFKIIGIVLGSILLGVLLVYLIVSFYYGRRFMPGTVINGTAANAMTVDELNRTLISGNDDYSVTIEFLEDSKEVLSGDDFDYCYDYSDSLNNILASQNQFMWPYYALYPSGYEASGKALFDEGKVISLLSGLPEYSEPYDNKGATVEIKRSTNTFVLVDERKPELNEASATKDVINCISNSAAGCDISGDYDEPSTSDDQQKILDNFADLNKVLNSKITLMDDDVKLVIDKSIIASWIKTDSNKTPVFDDKGKVLLNDEKVDGFVKVISETFGTDGKDRKWEKYKGGTVLLPCKWDGYIVDEAAEKEALLKSVLKGEMIRREPKYSQEGSGHGNKEVGDTYVEVDLSHQKMYFFKEGKLELESDIVSGCKRYHNDTPSMITKIYFMQEGRTLRGENYATFVYYWMAFYNHYGLHDATWRGKFGNDIYLTDGSHGCVNLPKDVAAELYGLVEVGTPVVLYE